MMVFDFVCLQIFNAKAKARFCSSVGMRLVTVLKSSTPSITKSLSCSRTPFNKVLNITFGNSTWLRFNRIRFFFVFKISKASSVKSGAIKISQNKGLIDSAAALSTVLLVANTPPNAEIGSQESALSYASFTVEPVATPQAFMCLMMTKAISLNSSKSERHASTSTKLL